jgi:glycerol uptake facilitator-like aquaporin
MVRTKLASEFIGTATLVAVVVGSGTMATNLSSDLGLALVINTISTILALGILIFLLAPLSGAHLNPAVTLSELYLKRISASESLMYITSQIMGGITGAMVANLMFSNPAIYPSENIRCGSNLYLAEIIATAGLMAIIIMAREQGKESFTPLLVASWIGSAYFFTSSTSFANPAVTIARAFSDTFSGIAAQSVPKFIASQLLGAAIGTLLATYVLTTRRK